MKAIGRSHANYPYKTYFMMDEKPATCLYFGIKGTNDSIKLIGTQEDMVKLHHMLIGDTKPDTYYGIPTSATLEEIE